MSSHEAGINLTLIEYAAAIAICVSANCKVEPVADTVSIAVRLGRVIGAMPMAWADRCGESSMYPRLAHDHCIASHGATGAEVVIPLIQRIINTSPLSPDAIGSAIKDIDRCPDRRSYN